MTVYCLLWPLYTAPSDELESTREGSLDAAPTYPEVLREAVARLFTTDGARVGLGVGKWDLDRDGSGVERARGGGCARGGEKACY
jgi:hypothetical protein